MISSPIMFVVVVEIKSIKFPTITNVIYIIPKTCIDISPFWLIPFDR